ncbi:hypothetical protein P9074_04970 [Gallibacterium anatis]
MFQKGCLNSEMTIEKYDSYMTKNKRGIIGEESEEGKEREEKRRKAL